MKDETINKAINKLTQLTGEDFHGYKSEICGVKILIKLRLKCKI